ncbi:hypothetical protein ABT275_46300 [Streptomyces sp. NPDC001185]|uniref:hypothetical protein n=1 Tax=Streptomyces sp. NPDC001185 TaxID=3154380 RepID=UPI003318C3F4
MDLLETSATLASGAALAFVGSLVNDWQTRRTEARKQRVDDRAELQAQADELLAAVLALKVAGNVHDHLNGGWKPRLVVGIHALTRAAAQWSRSGRGLPGVLTGYGEASDVISRWDRESAASAAGLAVPLTRLSVAVAPLMRRQEQDLAAATEAVYAAVVASDEEGVERALREFRRALLPVLDPPRARRRLSLRRGAGGSGRQTQ